MTGISPQHDHVTVGASATRRALDASWVAADGIMAEATTGTIVLTHAPAGGTFGTLSASVAPTGDDTARLELRWGGRVATVPSEEPQCVVLSRSRALSPS